MNTTLKISCAIAALTLLLTGGTGCVMPDDLSRMQKDLADVQLRLNKIQRDQEANQQLLEELAREGDRPDEDAVSREDIADTTLRVEQVLRQVSMSEERMNDFNRRLDRYSQDLEQTRELARRGTVGGIGFRPGERLGTGADDYGSADDPGGSPSADGRVDSGTVPDPEALYNTAYADFSKGNYALAVSGFEEYQQRFSESALADNALYWVAECHFSQGDYPAAIRTLDRLLASYPRSDKAAAADLKKALAHMEQNQVGQAIVQLRYVEDRYPGSDEARIARDKLRSLGD